MPDREQQQPVERLAILLGKAATPARVADTAQMLAKAVEAALPLGVAEDAITLVVKNLNMVATLRAWTPAGDEALTFLSNVVFDPVRTSQNDPIRTAGVARALAHSGKDMVDDGGVFFVPCQSDSPRIKLDRTLVHVLEQLASSEHTTRVHGGTQVYSVVLRVGRAKEQSSRHQVRLVINGKAQDVQLHADAFDSFVEAMRSGRKVKVELKACWRKLGSEFELDLQRTTAVRIDPTWRQADFTKLLAEPILSVEEGLAILSELEGDE
jgi:hypothetical protein